MRVESGSPTLKENRMELVAVIVAFRSVTDDELSTDVHICSRR